MLLIAGPTASGKSGLALKLAEQLPDPVIINADSMQVYADLRLVTARPNLAEEALVPHLLYGFRDGAEGLSAPLWRDAVRDLLPTVGGKSLIFVGGTGLYFRTLVEGLSPVPPVPDDIRTRVRARLEAEGAPALHADLDNAMADQLSPGDSQRVARALEVLLATGKSLADWQVLPPDGGLLDDESVTKLVLAPPRNWLQARIRQRAQTMLGEEALQEVRALVARGLPSDLPVMRAIGVSVIASYVSGEISHAEALDQLTVQTRRYAKRQETWFRGQMGDWDRMDPSNTSAEEMANQMMARVQVMSRV